LPLKLDRPLANDTSMEINVLTGADDLTARLHGKARKAVASHGGNISINLTSQVANVAKSLPKTKGHSIKIRSSAIYDSPVDRAPESGLV
jgi:hypothetical protein